MVETEQFKNKQLEEMIKERGKRFIKIDVTISALRGELDKRKKVESVWSTACHSSFSFDPKDHYNIVVDRQSEQEDFIGSKRTTEK